jgi:hypothetical protein
MKIRVEETSKIIDSRETCYHGNRDVTARLYFEDTRNLMSDYKNSFLNQNEV